MNQIMQRIEELRESNNLKKYELCDAIHLRQNTYSTWLKRDTSPDTENILQFADFFNVSTDYILRGIDVLADLMGHEKIETTRKYYIDDNLESKERYRKIINETWKAPE